VANLLLDEADARRRPLTNLVLQKLLYFAHARFLIEMKCPLLVGYFEAWRLGPVHPTVYQAFKVSGDRAIDFRASRADLLTGARSSSPRPSSPTVSDLLSEIVLSYGRMPAGRLVELSHAPNAPWDFIVNKHETSLAFGMRIPDNVIVERFKFHKIALPSESSSGEPRENSPFA
jgi:uncharacterized phage-associated protein